jgi:hypothetical protein
MKLLKIGFMLLLVIPMASYAVDQADLQNGGEIKVSIDKERIERCLESGDCEVQGDKLELSIDAERVKRGIKTGDFSCQSNCLQVSIDWERVRNFFGIKKN